MKSKIGTRKTQKRINNIIKEMNMKKILSIISAVVLSVSLIIPAFAAPKVMPDGGIFDPEYYAQTNPDVVAALGYDEAALYNHYLTCGKQEGRKPYADSSDTTVVTPTPTYDTEYMMAAYAYNYLMDMKVCLLNPDTVVIHRAYIIDDPNGNGLSDIVKLLCNRGTIFKDSVKVAIEYSHINNYGRERTDTTIVAITPYKSQSFDQLSAGNIYYTLKTYSGLQNGYQGVGLDLNTIVTQAQGLKKYKIVIADRKLADGHAYA